MQFDTEKRGYRKEDVIKYITNLEINSNKIGEEQRLRIQELTRQNEDLKVRISAYKNKEDLISKAIIDALARAKKIEENSRKIYELEIQKIRLLYNKYNNLLDAFIQSNASDEVVKKLEKNTTSLKSNIDQIFGGQSERFRVTQSADEKMRELLNKMNNAVAKRNETKEKVEYKQQSFLEQTEDTQRHAINIKPICDINLEKTDKFENLVDKFLESDETTPNAFAEQILGQTKTNGFDLKEAVNPTESLEDIMKSFNLDDEV